MAFRCLPPATSAPHLSSHDERPSFDDAVVDRLLDSSEPVSLNVAVDRKLDSIFDLEDAMKVQTCEKTGSPISGKTCAHYDAIDTGLFVCPVEIFDYLERAKSGSGRSDCSLADGVLLMAGDDRVRAIDIGEGGRMWILADAAMCRETDGQSPKGFRSKALDLRYVMNA